MSQDETKLNEARAPNENAAAQQKQTAKPEPDAPTEKVPEPHEIAKALNNDVILLLEAVVAAATHEDLRRCPALASICQAYQINRKSMVDWLERTKFRQAQRDERRADEKKKA